MFAGSHSKLIINVLFLHDAPTVALHVTVIGSEASCSGSSSLLSLVSSLHICMADLPQENYPFIKMLLFPKTGSTLNFLVIRGN